MRLVVEGWRHIDSSFALVNQAQLLELLERPGIGLSHRDAPMYENWRPAPGDAGLGAEATERIAAIPAPGAERADALYRISFPYRLGPGNAERVFVFMTSENHVFSPGHFSGDDPGDYRRHGVRIIAPSRWSKEGIVAAGFDEADVAIVPHGVDARAFSPLEPAARADARARLGVASGDVLFANVSAMTDNKGVDKLVLAFATLRQKYRNLRLVLKDQSYLYGTSAAGFLEVFRSRVPQLASEGVMGAIRVVPTRLDRAALREIYCAADAYVSPYRSEGFNLPPLEAAACGTPCLVTAGGATEDYFHPGFAARIESTPAFSDKRGRYFEPSLDHLIALMEDVVLGRRVVHDPQQGRRWVADNFSWTRAVDRLVPVLEGKPWR